MNLDINELKNDPVKFRQIMKLLEKTACENRLIDYLKFIWPILHPAQEDVLKVNWAVEALCQHLEWVDQGQIQRLLIEIPPRMSKPVYEEEYIPTDAGYKKLKHVKVGDNVLSHKGNYKKVTNVSLQGNLNTVCIITSNGNNIYAALDHPFLTQRGWVEAKDLGETKDCLLSPVDIEKNIINQNNNNSILYIFLNYIYDLDKKFKIDKNTKKNIRENLNKLGFYFSNINVEYKAFKTKYNLEDRDSFDNIVWFYNQLTHPEKIELLSIFYKQRSSITKNTVPIQGSQYEVCINFYDRCVADFVKLMLFDCNIHSLIDVKKNYDCMGNDKYVIKIRNRLDFKKFFDLIIYKIDPDSYTYYKSYCEDFDLEKYNNKLVEFDNNLYNKEFVISVKNSVNLKCRCLTVEDDESFLVRNVAVHNSVITSTTFPSWLWGPKEKPYKKILLGSYSLSQSEKNLKKMQDIMTSPIYKEFWGDVFSLQKKNVAYTSNDKSGEIYALGVDGGTTGHTGNINIADDLLNVTKAKVGNTLDNAYSWYATAFMNRLADSTKDSNILIAQRIDPKDVPGQVIANDLDFVRLTLPMEFDSNRKCYTINGWCDPRTYDGELLFPERWDEEEVSRIKKQVGPEAWNSQYQQNPGSSSSKIFLDEHFELIGSIENTKFKSIIRSWDFAGGIGQSYDWTAGTLLGLGREPDDTEDHLYLLDVKHFQMEPIPRRQTVKNIARVDDGVFNKIVKEVITVIPQDPGVSGKESRILQQEFMKPFRTEFKLERKGVKEERARWTSIEFGKSPLRVLSDISTGEKWNDKFLTELKKFPDANFNDDQVDALTLGLRYFMDNKKDNKIWNVVGI